MPAGTLVSAGRRTRFALAGVAVAGVNVSWHANDDPNASVAGAVAFAVLVVASAVAAGLLYPPLFRCKGARHTAGAPLRWGAHGEPRRTVMSSAPLVTVKALHSLVYLPVAAGVAQLIRDGLRGETGRRTDIAAGVVSAETVIFVGSRGRCPLTPGAERLGAERGSGTDIHLPGWLAGNLATTHVPLIALVRWLHWESLSRTVVRRVARPFFGVPRHPAPG